MDTFVVRVYRHLDEDGREMIGVVEVVGEEEKKSFTSVDEMVEIITGSQHEKTGTGQPRKPKTTA